jgi:hypothetical protein
MGFSKVFCKSWFMYSPGDIGKAVCSQHAALNQRLKTQRGNLDKALNSEARRFKKF